MRSSDVARFRVRICGLLGLLTLSGAVALAQPLPAAASGSPGAAAPGLTPVQPGPDGYFEYRLAPGASARGSVVVSNATSSSATYDLYAADATTSPVTGVAYGEARTSTLGTASWLSLSTSTVRLGAGARATVTFSVRVPPGATPGQHVAAVSAQTPNTAQAPQRAASGSSVSLVTNSRVVVAVVVDVPGAAALGATIGRPAAMAQRDARQVISIPMANTGALLMKPRLSGTLRACGSGSAHALITFRRQLDTFVPHTSIDYPWYAHRALASGCYLAQLELSATGRVLARFDGDVTVDPEAAVATPNRAPFGLSWLLAVVDAAALFFALAAFLYVLLRRRRPPTGRHARGTSRPLSRA